VGASTSHNPTVLHGLYRDSFIFFYRLLDRRWEVELSCYKLLQAYSRFNLLINTNWRNFMELVLLEKLAVVQPLKKFPVFYGSRRFTSMFKRCRYRSLSWARWVQSTTSHTMSLILSSHLRQALPSGLLRSDFPTKTLCLLRQESSLCSFLQPPVISFHLGPNILLSTLFSNTLCVSSSLNDRGQVSHP
jgi:hypothetical protein